jgi:hypothetical protein
MLVTPKMPHLPEGSVFFVQYPPRKTPLAKLSQPNTADRIYAAWIAVNDLRFASADMTSLGFQRVRHVRSKMLGAEGEEFSAASGKIILVHAKSPDGPVAQFSRERGEGVMGVTVLVNSVEDARALIQKNTARQFSPYKGWYGNSFLIPAAITSGVWIEMTAPE